MRRLSSSRKRWRAAVLGVVGTVGTRLWVRRTRNKRNARHSSS